MVRKEKELAVQDLSDKLKNNTAMLLTEYQGLTVAEITELRNKLRKSNCEYKVVKNTLSRRALEKIGFEEFSKYFNGPTAIAIDQGDPVETTKILVGFSKDHNKLKLKAGLLGDKFLTTEDIKSLASLPPRDVLLAQVIGTIQAPISGFVNVLSGVLRNFVNVVNEIKKQKESKGTE